MKKAVSVGLAGMTALFIAGDFIIDLPLTSDDGTDIIAVGISAVFSFLAILFLYPLMTKFFCGEIKSLSRPSDSVKVLGYIITQAVLIYIAVSTLTKFSEFVAGVMLPDVHLSVILIVAAATAFIISKQGTALSKTATILVFIALGLVMVIFLFSIPKMSFKYIIPEKLPTISRPLRTAVPIYFKSFAQILLPAAVIGSSIKGIKSIMIGNAVGAAFVVLCTLNALLVVGGGFASGLDYPYTAAVSTVAMGDIFSGMDGFLYITVIITCVIKTSVAFYAVAVLAQKVNKAKK